MRKNFLFMPLLALIGTTLLASCSSHLSIEDGALIKINDHEYSLKQIYDISRDSKEAAESYYNLLDNIYTQLAVPVDTALEADVDKEMQENFYDAAETNATENNTTVKEEQEKLLEAANVDTVEEYRNQKILEKQKTAASNDYYNDENVTNNLLGTYVDENAPYHVKHILVKVSATAGEYHRATITADEARKLGRVVMRLAEGGETFGDIAHTASDDTSSAANYGDLGIMDKQTSYVNEFKLGEYVWDMKYNSAVADKAKVKEVLAPSDAGESFDEDLNNYTLFGIPYSSALALNEYYDTEADDTGHTANNAESNNYPRNVIFNTYYNNHAMSLIFLSSEDQSNMATTYGADMGESSNAYARYTQALDDTNNRCSKTLAELGLENQVFTYKPTLVKSTDEKGVTTTSLKYEKVAVASTARVLTDEQGNPILVARAGNSSSSSDSSDDSSSNTYEGIHFIVNQRDPFQTYHHDEAHATEGDNIYTNEEYYSIDVGAATAEGAETNYLNYVKFSNNSDYTQRASSFKTSNIQASDPNNTFAVFNSVKAKTEEDGYVIHIPDAVNELVNEYIDSTSAKNIYDKNNTYDRAWNSYFQALNFQQDTASLNLPMTSIEQFADGNIPIYIDLTKTDLKDRDNTIDLSAVSKDAFTNYQPSGAYGVDWIYNPAYVGAASGFPATGSDASN